MPEDEEEPDDRPIPPSRPFLVALVIAFLILALLLTGPYLGAVVLALLTAFIVHPVYRRLVPFVRWPTLAASLMLILVILVVLAPIAFVFWQMLDELQAILAFISDPAKVQEQFGNLLANLGVDPERATEILTTAGERVAQAVAGMILPTIQFIFHALFSLVIFLFVLFFAIRDGDSWVTNLKAYIPLSPEDKDHLFHGISESTWAILIGTFVVSIFQGVIAGIGWWIFGFPNPIFWGFVMVLLSVFPFLGPFMVTLPAAGFALYQGDYVAGIGLIIWTLVIVGISDDAIRPYLIGKRSGAHPIFILLGIVGDISLFGVAGFILGPIIFALLIPVLDVWARRRKALAARQGIPDGRSLP